MPIPALAALGYKAFDEIGGVAWAKKRLGLTTDVYDKYMYHYKLDYKTGGKSVPVFSLEDGHHFQTPDQAKHFLRTKNAKKIDVWWYHVQDIPSNEGAYMGMVVLNGIRYDANLWGVDASAYSTAGKGGMPYEDIPAEKRNNDVVKGKEIQDSSKTPDAAPRNQSGLMLAGAAMLAMFMMKD